MTKQNESAEVTETQEKATEEVKKAPKKAAKETETAFPLYQLREHARELFGVKPEVFDGVFSTAKEEALTKTEAEKRIKAFFEKEVN